MPVRKAIIEAEIGLHARPAAQFVRAVTDTCLPITISKEGIAPVDARSLLEVMTADFACGCEVELAVAEGAIPEQFPLDYAEAALDALCALLAAGGTVPAAGGTVPAAGTTVPAAGATLPAAGATASSGNAA